MYKGHFSRIKQVHLSKINQLFISIYRIEAMKTSNKLLLYNND